MLEIHDQNGSNFLEGTPLPNAGTFGLPQKQKVEGFVPAWRRKSLDDINRIKHERRGELFCKLFESVRIDVSFFHV